MSKILRFLRNLLYCSTKHHLSKHKAFKRCFSTAKLSIFLVFTLIIGFLFSFSSTQAQIPSGYSEFYIPGPEQDMWDIFEDLDNSPNLVEGSGMHSVISVVPYTDNITVYYDHWEDGYDFDPDTPGTADETYVINSNDILELESSNIPIDPRGSAVYYDGGDRIYTAGGTVTISRASWPESIGTIFALSWELYPVKAYLVSYISPFGIDLATSPPGGPGYDDFEDVYVIAQSMADSNDIVINDPTTPGDDITVTLDKGESTQLYRIHTGTTVTGTEPVQVQYIVGEFHYNTASEARGFTGVPDSLWDNEYYSPVSGSSSGDMDLLLYNPNAYDITINFEDKSGSGSFIVGADSSATYSDGAGRYVPNDSGVFVNSDDVFWGVGMGDTEGFNYDWGFSLIPVNFLKDQYKIGWSPGTSQATPTSNGSPVYITAVNDETTVFIDYGPVDGVIDASYEIDRLDAIKVFDPDNDNTGMEIIATGEVAVVWGEDPDSASSGNPYLDMGYTTVPVSEEWIDVVLINEKTANPNVLTPGAGNVSHITLSTETRDFPVDDIDVFDFLPTSFNYVPNSTTITLPDSSTYSGASYNPGISGSDLTWNIGGYGLDDDLEANEALTVEFDIITTGATTHGLYQNDSQSSGTRLGGAQVFSPIDTAYIYIPDVTIDKDTNTPRVVQGGQAEYTIEVTNNVDTPLTDVTISDSLATGFTYDSSSVTETNATRTSTSNPSTGDTSLTWGTWDIDPDGSVVITFTVDVDGAMPLGVYDDTATMTSNETGTVDDDGTVGQDPNTPFGADPEDDEDVEIILSADLELSKDVDNNTPFVGDNVTFTIDINNVGPNNATGVTVSDLLPNGFSYVSDTPSVGTYNDVTGIWDIGNLNNGSSASLQIIATVLPTGDYDNIAQVQTSDQGDIDSTPGNNVPSEDDQDNADVNPIDVIDLWVDKTVNNSNPDVESVVTFTIDVTNDGPSAATNVSVYDLLPDGYIFVSSSDPVNYNDSTGVWTIGNIPATGSVSLDISATVLASGIYLNSAEVLTANEYDPDSTPGNGVSTEDDYDSETVTPNPIIDLALNKNVDNSTPNVGDNVTFTIEVDNDGPSDASGIVVNDILPTGYSFVSSSDPGNYDEITGDWNVGGLVNGASASLDITATVLSGASPADYNNIAQVSAADQDDSDSTPGNNNPTEDDQDNASTSPVPVIDLSLTKDVDDPTPNYGDNVNFTINITNDGPSDATGVTVRDLLPAGYSYVSDTPSTGSYSNVSGIWTIGNIGNGASESLVIEANVLVDSDYDNIAQVWTANENDVDSDPGNSIESEDDQDNAECNPNPQIDLSLDKTINNPTPDVGSNITFTIDVTNDGPSDATGVTVEDILPSGYTYDSHTTSTGAYDDGTGIWNIGTINNSDTVSLDITATVNSSGTYENVAQVETANENDPDSTPGNDDPGEDDQDSVTCTPNPVIDLELTKDIDNATPDVDTDVNLSISLTNAGPSNATSVTVQDQLPSGLTYVSHTSSPGTSYDDVTGIWTIGNLANGATVDLDMVTHVETSGDYTNVAQVWTANETDPDSTPANNVPSEDDQDDAPCTPTPIIDISLTKDVDNATPLVGSNVVFTVNVANAGPSDATGVDVSDLLPTGFSYVSHVSTAGTYDDGTGLWDIGDINSGDSKSLTITATVLASGDYDNIAEVTAADQEDEDSTPNNNEPTEDDQDNAICDPIPQIDLSLNKDIDNATPFVGSDITFTIEVSNDGPSDATGVTVEDILPSGYTYVSDTPSVGIYDDGSGIWSIGDINNGNSATLEITATVLDSGIYENIAQVETANEDDVDSAPGNDNETEDDQDSADCIPVPVIDLELTKDIDNMSPDVNSNVSFTLSLLNNGPSNATGVSVTDLLPDGYNYVSDNPTIGSYDDGTGVWVVGSLNNGVTETLEIVAEVNGTGDYTNIAEVTTATETDSDSTPGNNIATEDDQDSVTPTPNPVIDLELDKTVNNPTPDIGSNISFGIRVTNNGPSNATGIAVTDELPSGYTYISSDSTQGSYNDTTGIWSIGDLNIGNEAVLNIIATVEDLGDYNNTAEVSAATETDIDSTPNNNDIAEDDQDNATIVPNKIIDLELTKEVSDATPIIGDSVTFTLDVVNVGPSSATGVVVTDELPSGYEFVSSSTDNGEYNSDTGSWNIGTIALNDTVTLNITAKVLSTGNYNNIAEVSTANETDSDSTPGNGISTEDDQDNASVEVDTGVVIMKSADPENGTVVFPDDVISYTLRYENNTDTDLTEVVVTDTINETTEYINNLTLNGAPLTDEIDSDEGDFNNTTKILTVNVGDLPADSSGVISFKVKVRPAEFSKPGVRDRAIISTKEFGDKESNLVVHPVDPIEITKVMDVPENEPLVAGQVINWTVKVTNIGYIPTTNVTVTDTVPVETTYIENSIAGRGSDDSDAPNLVWNVGVLAVDEEVTLTFQSRVNEGLPAGTVIRNLATVDSDQSDPLSDTDTNSVETPTIFETLTNTGKNIALLLLGSALAILSGIYIAIIIRRKENRENTKKIEKEKAEAKAEMNKKRAKKAAATRKRRAAAKKKTEKKQLKTKPKKKVEPKKKNNKS